MDESLSSEELEARERELDERIRALYAEVRPLEHEKWLVESELWKRKCEEDLKEWRLRHGKTSRSN